MQSTKKNLNFGVSLTDRAEFLNKNTKQFFTDLNAPKPKPTLAEQRRAENQHLYKQCEEQAKKLRQKDRAEQYRIAATRIGA
jgi:hypothetical protein